MADNRIEIDIILNDGTVAKGLLRAEKEAVTSGKKIGNSLERGVKAGAGNAFAGLRSTLLGLGAAFAGAFATRAIIDAASKQEDAINSLNQALKSAGTFSKAASKDFQDFASGLQGRSIIGDEALLEAAALARNFTKTNEQAKKLTEAALELSSATGKDLTSSLEQLGKTFGGSLGRLAELVPDLKNLTQEQLKAGEATDFIISRFSGSALAKTKTFSGAIDQLSNTFGDLLEEFGFAITRSKFVVSAINSLNATFKGFILTVQGFSLSEFADSLRRSVAEGTDPLIRGIRIASAALVFFLSKAVVGGVIAFIPVAISVVAKLGLAFLTMARNVSLARVGLNLFKASATLGITLILDQVIGLVAEIGSIGGAFEIIKLRAQQGFEQIRIAFLKLVSAIVNNPLSSLIYGDRTAEFKIDIQAAEDKIEILGNKIQAIRDGAASLSGSSGSSTLGSSDTTIPAGETEDLETKLKAKVEIVPPSVESLTSFNQMLFQSVQAPLTGALEGVGKAILGTSEQYADTLARLKDGTADFATGMRASLAVGAVKALKTFQKAGGQAFGKFAADLANGEAKLSDFGTVIFGLIGDVLFQLGTQLIAAGIGNLIAFNYALGGAQIAGGSAISAAGGVLKKKAGGGGSAAPAPSVTSATAGGGGVSAGQIGNISEDAPTGLGETAQRGRQANIEVNIQGNVLDRRETALEIVQVLEEASFAGIEVAV